MAHRGMLPSWERKRRARQLPGSALPRLVPAHHPCHDRPEFPRRSRPPTPREKGGSAADPDTTEPPDAALDDACGTTRPGALPSSATAATPSPLRRRIRLTLAEIRGLFNLRDQAKHTIHAALNWSTYRREHQADARAPHFTRRLKIQYLAL